MNIHEYQAKELLSKSGMNVPAGKVAFSSEQAVQIAGDLHSEGFVVKAQIHAGGRGKGGGVKLAATIEDVKSLTSDMIGMNLVTHQTGPEGKLVSR